MLLNANYWENRYRQGETTWDAGSVTTPISDYCGQLLQKDLRIFIPGCGNAHEAAFLLAQGFTNITLLDFAETPVMEARAKFADAIAAGSMHIVCEDFFEHHGSYDLILEQTFFCAIDPTRRPAYAKKMFELLNPGGKLCGLLFDFPLSAEGPPFGGGRKQYLKLFNPYFIVKTLEPCYNSIKPRAGRELFFIFEKEV